MTREGIRMKDFVSMVNPLGTTLRNAATWLVTRLPKLGPFVRQGDFIPKPTYRAGSYFGLRRKRWRGAEGRLMPQPNLRGPDGRRRLEIVKCLRVQSQHPEVIQKTGVLDQPRTRKSL
mgnify:CR=1 FL=1